MTQNGNSKNRFLRTAAGILVLLLMMTAALAAAAAENLIENGSFEELNADGLPAGWTTDAYVKEEGYSLFSIDDADAVDGERAAAIRNIGDNDARFMQKVRVEPESLYRFSGYIRTEEVEGGRGANLSIEGMYTFSESVFDTSDGWEYIEWYGETGEDQTSVTLFARLGGYSGESRGRAWFDDLKLEKVQVVPGNMIASKWYQEKAISYYDEEEEISGEGNASPAWPQLIVISLAYTATAVLILQWLQRRRQEPGLDNQRQYKVLLWCGLGLSLILRIVLSWFIEGYMVDVNCFTAWGSTMARVGPAGFYPETNFCDYPPAYTYILGLNALICRAVPNISAGMTRVIYRFFPAVCDLAACLALDQFLRKSRPEISALGRTWGILLLAFHPVAVLNCAAWGQMDSSLSILLLVVAMTAIQGKWAVCLPVYMLAVLVKPQALMLGPLGLIAILHAWIREKRSRKHILIGIVAALAVLLIIVIPFSLRQDPFWIINQYAGTLASYPYATVNTTNFYYLMNGNWSAIERTAPWTASLILGLLSAGYGIGLHLKARQIWKHTWIELVLSLIAAAWFAFCGFTGASWGMIGTAAMVMAFVIAGGLYLRKGDIRFLPLAGGILFLILYVFGVKMHERYIFPAFLLLALAYGLKQDRRILIPLLAVTCTAFINEGIVLDNSIRLGSSMGHLNQDTSVLNMILGCVNCLTAAYAAWTGIDKALGKEPALHPVLREPVRDNLLHWKKKDTLILAGILAAYSVISFGTLGSMKAPQTAWTSSEYTENVIIDLGEERESFTMLYFARVSRYDFSVASSLDGETWEDETWAQMDQGQCWKWKYVTDSTSGADGTRNYGSARHWFSGRYVRITAHQINLALCEVIFRDENGNQLPVVNVTRKEGDPESTLYSDPAFIADEQDSLEAMPVYFDAESADSEGEENPNTAQPSWWNSTYFDEIYHARTAWEFLNGSAPYETSHPPLGKVLMSWGVALFGMTPFGWRFAGALAGVAMLAVIYLILKQMTKESAPAAFGCGLFALDCMHLTQTQIATIDSFPVLFILTAFFFLLRFLQTDWRTEKRRRIMTDLLFSGFAMGLAIASKWIGIYAGAGLAILFFWHGGRVLLQDRKEHLTGTEKRAQVHADAFRKFLRICLWCIPCFVIIPVLIYVVSYLPYFAYRNFTSIGDYLEALIASQEGMFNYHSTPGLGMDHPFYSPWYEWPVIGKPMFYSTKQYIFNDELSFSIFCIGNPVIWWAGIPGMICAAWIWIRNRREKILLETSLWGENGTGRFAGLDTNLVFLIIGFLAQYLPWTLVPRGTYIYHYFASVPFLIISLTLCAEQVRLRTERGGRIAMIIFTLLAAAAFIFFFPYVSGILSPVGWLDLGRGILKIWY